MTGNQWKTYRTRFLVKAKQLNSDLSFTDALGRQHCGRKGDYLVESFEGVISIAPRAIFEDIYVAMRIAEDLPLAIQNASNVASAGVATSEEALPPASHDVAALRAEAVPRSNFQRRRRSNPATVPGPRRKAPQPVHTAGLPTHAGVM